MNAQGSNQENQRPGQGNQGQNNGNSFFEVNYVRYGNYNSNKNFNQGNYVNNNDRSWPYALLQNHEVSPRDGGGNMARVEDMIHKMMRKFDASDHHTTELRNDLVGIS